MNIEAYCSQLHHIALLYWEWALNAKSSTGGNITGQSASSMRQGPSTVLRDAAEGWLIQKFQSYCQWRRCIQGDKRFLHVDIDHVRTLANNWGLLPVGIWAAVNNFVCQCPYLKVAAYSPLSRFKKSLCHVHYNCEMLFLPEIWFTKSKKQTYRRHHV